MEQPSVFFVPFFVRYDNNLFYGSRLLFGEILRTRIGLSCMITNREFATLYDVTPTTVSRWVKQLIEAGYLNSSFTQDPSVMGGHMVRRLWLTDSALSYLTDELGASV